MEKAVNDLIEHEILQRAEESVKKPDYRLYFYLAAAFLIGGAAIFGFIDPAGSYFLLVSALVLASAWFLCRSLTLWSGKRKNSLDAARSSLAQGEAAFRSLAEIYGRPAGKKTVMDREGYREFFRQIDQEICRRCYQETNCWEIYSGRTEQYLRQLFQCAQSGRDAYDENIDRRNGFLCENRLAMAALTKNLWKQAQTDYKWKSKMESSREALAAQFQGTARVFRQSLEQVGRVESPERSAALKAVEIGVSKYARDGMVCGDSCAGVKINDRQYLFLLSDGMGSGKEAARESLLTINTLYQFLKAGFPAELSLDAMNALLILKSREEIFATVDMAVLDLETGVMDFYKAGSAAAFIRRENRIEVIKKAGLPMGIVEHVKTETVEKRLKPGDMILMISDGILDAGAQNQGPEEKEEEEGREEESWVKEYLSQIRSGDPQTVADLIMQKAMDRCAQQERDDMCALVIAVL